MANTKVEILGNQLSGTIMNAASEATLQEIVRAVGGMNKTMSRGAAGGAPSAGGGGGGGGGIFSSAMETIGDQLGNMVGAVGSFAGLLANNNTKLSSYTSVLNNQVVKNLPAVGKILGTFGDVINYTIGQMEEWNDALKKTTQSGASFGNSIIRLRQAANDSYLSLDEFVDIVRNNSSVLVGFGNTVTEGAEEFARYNKLVKQEGGVTRETLRQIGYSSKDVSDALMRFMTNTQRGAARKNQTDKDFEKQFLFYEMNLVKLRALTGIQAQKLEEQMAIANMDMAYQLKKSTLLPQQQTMLEAGLANFVTLYGSAGAEVFKALFAGVAPQSDEANNLLSLFQRSGKSAQTLINEALKGGQTMDGYNAILRETFGRDTAAQAEFFRRNRDFVGAISGLQGGQNSLYKSMQGAGANVIRMGGPVEATYKKATEAYDQAAKEANDRDKLTQFINDMNMAFGDLKKHLIDAVLPMLSELGTYLKSEEVASNIRKFGQELKLFILNSIPVVTTFFKHLETEEGRQFIKEELAYYFDRMMITLKYAISRAWYSTAAEQKEKGLTKEDQQKEYDALDAMRTGSMNRAGVPVENQNRFLGADPYVAPPSGNEKSGMAPWMGHGMAGSGGGQNRSGNSRPYATWEENFPAGQTGRAGNAPPIPYRPDYRPPPWGGGGMNGSDTGGQNRNGNPRPYAIWEENFPSRPAVSLPNRSLNSSSATSLYGVRAATEAFMKTHRIGQQGGIVFMPSVDPSMTGISSRVGMRNGVPHAGTDRNVLEPFRKNSIPVYAMRPGDAYAGTASGYGNFVSVYDPQTNTTILYGHLHNGTDSLNAQRYVHGKSIEQGTLIGYMGNTGRSRGRHLHEELRVGRPGPTGLPTGQLLDSSAILGYRDGTLGSQAPANQSMDVAQMENIARAGAAIPLNDLMSTFNNNMNTLISLTKERIDVQQRQVDATRKLSKNLLV